MTILWACLLTLENCVKRLVSGGTSGTQLEPCGSMQLTFAAGGTGQIKKASGPGVSR